MQGISDRDYALVRYTNFLGEVLAPTCTLASTPLDIGVFQTDERQAYDAATRARYRRVELGWRWGPAWSTAWFRLRGKASDEQRALLAKGAARQEQDAPYLAMAFSSGTEALLWRDAAPCRGFDDNRDLFRLEGAPAGSLTFLIEAACNMPLGVSTFWWDGPEVQKRWREAAPGRLERAELVVRDPAAERAVADYRAAVETAAALDEKDPRCLELLRRIRAVTDDYERAQLIPGRAPHVAELLAPLRLAARGPEDQSPLKPADTTCHAVGHAHLDTAWLWPMAETRRKAQRSFTNALELLERHDGFRFAATQPQQYAWIAEDSPELFERIRAAAATGRWETSGAMWIEPDCNAPSGESLVRQIVHGQAYQRATFGPDAAPAFLFLPDTFGFPACLPQLLHKAGLDSFLTDKMAWSERNSFPHVTFHWRGLDGTELLTHLTPGTNYNAPITPTDLRRAEARLVERDAGPIGPERAFFERWLQPFGFGDGGGGPTEEQLGRADRAAVTPGLPRVEHSTIGGFCDALHGDVRTAADAGQRPPVWDGPLYIENHRGTFTSQAWLKEANTRVERGLARAEELLATRVLIEGATAATPALRARFDAAWKTLLLHQFHDILPGSSIQLVFDEAREAFKLLERELAALTLAAAGANRRDDLYPLTRTTSERLPELPHEVDAIGMVETELDGTVATLRNDHVVVEVHPTGDLYVRRRRLVDDDLPLAPWTTEDGEDVPGDFCVHHHLGAFADRPRQWDAWNLDYDHVEAHVPVNGKPSRAPRSITKDSRRTTLELPLSVGKSRLRMRVSLAPHQCGAEIELDTTWREDQVLLRAHFATPIRAQRWTVGTQLGFVEWPSHANTAIDEARFEVPGQRWMDVSQPGRGVAILDECKLGRSSGIGPNVTPGTGGSAHPGVQLGLTLLRSPNFPDPTSDRGRHHLRYAIVVHDGDWRAAQVPARAAAFADETHELAGTRLPVELASSLRSGPFDLTSNPAGAVEVMACKLAEDGKGLIVRLAERHGGEARAMLSWHAAVPGVRETDLLERGLDEARAAWLERRPDSTTPFDRVGVLEHESATTSLDLAPFEVRTLRVDLPGSPA